MSHVHVLAYLRDNTLHHGSFTSSQVWRMCILKCNIHVILRNRSIFSFCCLRLSILSRDWSCLWSWFDTLHIYDLRGLKILIDRNLHIFTSSFALLCSSCSYRLCTHWLPSCCIGTIKLVYQICHEHIVRIVLLLDIERWVEERITQQSFACSLFIDRWNHFRFFDYQRWSLVDLCHLLSPKYSNWFIGRSFANIVFHPKWFLWGKASSAPGAPSTIYTHIIWIWIPFQS